MGDNTAVYFCRVHAQLRSIYLGGTVESLQCLKMS